jgi:hypothetical protein
VAPVRPHTQLVLGPPRVRPAPAPRLEARVRAPVSSDGAGGGAPAWCLTSRPTLVAGETPRGRCRVGWAPPRAGASHCEAAGPRRRGAVGLGRRGTRQARVPVRGQRNPCSSRGTACQGVVCRPSSGSAPAASGVTALLRQQWAAPVHCCRVSADSNRGLPRVHCAASEPAARGRRSGSCRLSAERRYAARAGCLISTFVCRSMGDLVNVVKST